jgi:type II secretory pathway pseudopilin PulG
MLHRSVQDGSAPALLLVALSLAVAASLAVPIAGDAVRSARERASERALAAAREALLAYATGRPIDPIVGPGYLPCPDLDNDGWAESTCGSQSGDSGQAQRLGRLPWKTLGIPELRDGHGERLWYAVSSKHKGLLNCTVSATCVDMSPDAALGTITVRDSSGRIVRDGRIADLHRTAESGAAAIVIAPGPALRQVAGTGRVQQRDCTPATCDANGRCTTNPPTAADACNPVNFLDRAAGTAFADESNADFLDRNDPAGRALNANGFIRGPVRLADGSIAVNDRLAEIGYEDLVPRLMRRVATEVAACLTRHAGVGSLPAPAPPCLQEAGDPAGWEPLEGLLFGRVPSLPYPECAFDPAAPAPNWWLAWRRHVFYAIAADERVSGAANRCTDASNCLEVVAADGALIASGKRAAILVAGAPLAATGQFHSPGFDAGAAAWLEEPHLRLEWRNANPAAPGCPASALPSCPSGEGCNRVRIAPRDSRFNDVVATIP